MPHWSIDNQARFCFPAPVRTMPNNQMAVQPTQKVRQTASPTVPAYAWVVPATQQNCHTSEGIDTYILDQ